MEAYKEKLCQEYALSPQQAEELLSKMEVIHFKKGDFVVREGERNTNLYIIKSGLWRCFRMNDGEEVTLWFAAEGECVFPIWGYTNAGASKTFIEAENESLAYYLPKKSVDELCANSLTMANTIRTIFENHALWVENFLLFFADHNNAAQRYQALIERFPDLLQQVPLKKMASYLFITPQSLSRIRAKLKRKQE